MLEGRGGEGRGGIGDGMLFPTVELAKSDTESLHAVEFRKSSNGFGFSIRLLT